jgi:TM2 domain-containing membrane protein YozV
MSTSANPVTADATIRCPYCAEEISAAAKKCKHCGEFLDSTLREARTQTSFPQERQTWNPGTAAVLSLLIPGTGQMYKGRVGAGLCWLIGVAVGYFAFIVPGVILHIACVYNAYYYDPTKAKEAKPASAEPPRAPYDPKKHALYKVGRAWNHMTTRR